MKDFTQQTLFQQTDSQLQQALESLGRLDQTLSDISNELQTDRSTQTQRYQALQNSLGEARKALAELRTSLGDMGDVLRNHNDQIAGKLSELSKTLSAVKEVLSVVESQARHIEAMAQTLERIEDDVEQITSIFLGRRGGRAAEQLVGDFLSILPKEWVLSRVRMEDGEVEYALAFPGGFLVPLDSKFVKPELIKLLEECEGDDHRRRELERQIRQAVPERAREITAYLNDRRALGFGIAAVPDPVYIICREIMGTVAERHQIVLVPYSMLVPFALSLYLMAQRLGIRSRIGDVEQALGAVITALNQANQIIR